MLGPIPSPPSAAPGDARAVEMRLSALEASVQDIKELLTKLEPVLSDMDNRIRTIEAERLPTLEAEIAEAHARIWGPHGTIQVVSSIGGVIAFVTAVAAAGLFIAGRLIR